MPPSVEQRELEIDGAPIAYWVEGSGEPLILLHGYGCTSQDWATVASLLADKWQVIRFDFPAHGASGGRAPLSLSDLVRCTASVVNELCDSPPTLVGHSMGGMAAIAYALKGAAPLRRLVLAEAFPHLGSVVDVFGGPEDPDDPYGYGSVIDRQTPPPVVRYIRREMAAGTERAGTDLFDSLLEFDARPALRNIPYPISFLLGDRRWVDSNQLPSILERLGYSDIPSLTVRLIHSHHFIMLEQPYAVAGAIGSFLQKEL